MDYGLPPHSVWTCFSLSFGAQSATGDYPGRLHCNGFTRRYWGGEGLDELFHVRRPVIASVLSMPYSRPIKTLFFCWKRGRMNVLKGHLLPIRKGEGPLMMPLPPS